MVVIVIIIILLFIYFFFWGGGEEFTGLLWSAPVLMTCAVDQHVCVSTPWPFL